MPSLTPMDQRDKVVDEAFSEGLVNGFLTLIPATGAVLAATNYSPAFRRITNVQARTALAIMPALFMFTLTSEERVVNDMRNMAKQAQHAHDSVHWAETQKQYQDTDTDTAQRLELHNLYKRAVYESGVRVIPGDTLQPYHVAANYIAENPFKILASMAVPGIAWIFYGRTGQEHLTFSMKIMHTRVFGQFATISSLLGVMGFKEMMDRQGKFITEAEAEARVEEMEQVRMQMLARLEVTRQAQQAYNDEIQKAHEADVREGHVHAKKVSHKKKKKKVHVKKLQEDDSLVVGEEVPRAAATLALSPTSE